MFKNLTTNLLLSLMFMASTVSAMNEKYADAPETKTVIVRQLDPLALKKEIPAHLLPAIFSYIIDTQDDEGNTIIHHAVYIQDISMIHKLIGLHANPNIKNRYNKTALETVQINAQDHNNYPKNRNKLYNVWKILDNAGIKNSIPYTTKPNFAELDEQFEIAEFEQRWYVQDCKRTDEINNKISW